MSCQVTNHFLEKVDIFVDNLVKAHAQAHGLEMPPEVIKEMNNKVNSAVKEALEQCGEPKERLKFLNR
jgi:hypothetical protein